MDQFFNQSPYGKISLEFDQNFSQLRGEMPNRTEKRQLMLLSTVVGLCVIVFILLQNYIPDILVKLGFAKIYLSNDMVAIAIDILISIVCIFLPFLVAARLSKRITPETEILPYKKPVSVSLFCAAIAMGGLALLLSNMITNAFVFYMEKIGVTFTSPSDGGFSGGTPEFLMYLVRGAVVPALVEEFGLRGVVMQPLRKFGDKFAILISSLVFAFMHGNMVQAPFAFILGCAIGYLVIVTDSLWTGVAIHFMNNAYSIVLTYISTKMDYQTYFRAFSISSAVMVVFGVAAFMWFALNRKKYRRLNTRGGATKALRKRYTRAVNKAYFLNPFLLTAFGILIYNMTDYISLGG